MKNHVVIGLMFSIFCVTAVQAQEKADEQLKQEVRRAVQKALDQDAEARLATMESNREKIEKCWAIQKRIAGTKSVMLHVLANDDEYYNNCMPERLVKYAKIILETAQQEKPQQAAQPAKEFRAGELRRAIRELRAKRTAMQVMEDNAKMWIDWAY